MSKLIEGYDWSRFDEYEEDVKGLVKLLGFQIEKKQKLILRPGDKVLCDNIADAHRVVITRAMYKKMRGSELSKYLVPVMKHGSRVGDMTVTHGHATYYYKDGVKADTYEDETDC